MPYGIDPALWVKLPADDQAAIAAESLGQSPPAIGGYAPATPPPPPAAAAPPPPPPPLTPPVVDVGSSSAAVSVDVAGRPIYYTDGRWYYADGSEAAGPGAAPPAGVSPPPPPPPLDTPPAAEPGDSLDDEPDAEAGDQPTDADYAAFDVEAAAIESGAIELLAVTHPAPGTVIGEPYVGTHAIAFNRAGGSDNWQSENAVDVWLFPGTAILACWDGVISPGGYGYGLSSSGGRFAGWRLHLVSDDGKAFFYTHLSSISAKKGARVVKGQIIARSGIANGVPHLHFAARPPLDPRAFYKAAFSVKDRSAVAPPVIGGVGLPQPPPVGQVNDDEVSQAWSDLMRVFGLGLPAATAHIRDARQSLGQAVS